MSENFVDIIIGSSPAQMAAQETGNDAKRTSICTTNRPRRGMTHFPCKRRCIAIENGNKKSMDRPRNEAAEKKKLSSIKIQ